MTATRLFAAAALSAFIALPALAQGTSPAPTDPATPDPAPAADAMPAQDMAAPPAPVTVPVSSPSAMEAGTNVAANVTVKTVTNGPIPDTAENRAKYGKPDSNAGKRSKPAGN